MITSFINIGSIEATIVAIVACTLLIYAIYLIVQKETGWSLFFWMVFVLFVPLAGAMIYLAKHLLSDRRSTNSTL
ncbi:hypothetical protein [Sphingobacterium paludis]|uniref:Uncharacterized protein n=1 Tax=Sphingobacterium paludis TaxID=1476465 RepID=A0A4R7CTK2_9SPHI|nr:hypothetical protein [Sphingobacterium paludis]TDS11739.1 hypothetical protein B0I21_10780 [Sphingobacterium paludis]